MSVPKRQFKFECSEEFYQRSMEEKLQRNLTLQQMAIRGLELVYDIPEYGYRAAEETAKTNEVKVGQIISEALLSKMRVKGGKPYLKPSFPTKLSGDDLKRAVEHENLVSTIATYLRELPTEKVRPLSDMLAVDVKHYRSSRIKPVASKESLRGQDGPDQGGR